MTALGEILGIGRGILNDQVIQIFEIRHIVAGQRSGRFRPALRVAQLIIILDVRQMPCDAPGRLRIQISRAERVKAERVGVLVDRFGDQLERVEILYLIHAEPRLFDQSGVDRDAVALQTIRDGDQLTLFIGDVIVDGGLLLLDLRFIQIERIIHPLGSAVLVVDDEQRRRIIRVHLLLQHFLIRAGLRRFDLDFHAGLFLILFRQLLEGFIQLGLEVQPVDISFIAAESAGNKGQHHHHRQDQRQKSLCLHCRTSYLLNTLSV